MRPAGRVTGGRAGRPCGQGIAHAGLEVLARRAGVFLGDERFDDVARGRLVRAERSGAGRGGFGCGLLGGLGHGRPRFGDRVGGPGGTGSTRSTGGGTGLAKRVTQLIGGGGRGTGDTGRGGAGCPGSGNVWLRGARDGRGLSARHRGAGGTRGGRVRRRGRRPAGRGARCRRAGGRGAGPGRGRSTGRGRRRRFPLLDFLQLPLKFGRIGTSGVGRRRGGFRIGPGRRRRGCRGVRHRDRGFPVDGRDRIGVPCRWGRGRDRNRGRRRVRRRTGRGGVGLRLGYRVGGGRVVGGRVVILIGLQRAFQRGRVGPVGGGRVGVGGVRCGGGVSRCQFGRGIGSGLGRGGVFGLGGGFRLGCWFGRGLGRRRSLRFRRGGGGFGGRCRFGSWFLGRFGLCRRSRRGFGSRLGRSLRLRRGRGLSRGLRLGRGGDRRDRCWRGVGLGCGRGCVILRGPRDRRECRQRAVGRSPGLVRFGNGRRHHHRVRIKRQVPLGIGPVRLHQPRRKEDRAILRHLDRDPARGEAQRGRARHRRVAGARQLVGGQARVQFHPQRLVQFRHLGRAVGGGACRLGVRDRGDRGLGHAGLGQHQRHAHGDRRRVVEDPTHVILRVKGRCKAGSAHRLATVTTKIPPRSRQLRDSPRQLRDGGVMRVPDASRSRTRLRDAPLIPARGGFIPMASRRRKRWPSSPRMRPT